MTTITRDQVAAALIEACEANPDKINPMGHNREGLPSCLYDDGLGNHCMAGQVMVNLTGETFDKAEFSGILYLAHRSVMLHEYDEGAVRLLGAAQAAADNADEEGLPHPQPWGDVLDRLRENGDLG